MSRNTTKLSLAKKIPVEFDLSKYENCKEWKAIDWYHALTTRAVMRHRHKANNDCQHDAISLLENPLNKEMITFGVAQSPIIDQTIGEFFEAISLVECNRKYRDLYEKLPEIDDIQAFELDSPDLVPQLQPAWQVHEAFSPKQTYNYRFTINVDLRSPDEFLIKEFKEWVNKTRMSANIQRKVHKFSQSDFNKWHENRYLPLLDLEFWAETTEQRISYPMLCETLFNDVDGGDVDRVRKTIVGNANDLLSNDYWSALKSQATCL